MHSPALPHAGLTWPDYAAVAGYLLLTMLIVGWASRRQKNTEDFFLGGRRMPAVAVGLSIMATLLSTITYLGFPGEVIKNGIAIFAGYLAFPFVMAFILLLLVPFFMRLRMTSAYEYLERRFDYRTRLLGGLLFLLLRLGWISVVVYTASLALVAMTRGPLEALLATNALTAGCEPLYVVVVAVGLASTIYASIGGMRAVIWTDVVQTFMLFGGAALIIGYVFWATGAGPSLWWARASELSTAHTSPPWFSFDPTVRMTVFTAIVMTFTWNVCTHGSDQVVLQRYFTTDSLASASKSYIVSVLSQIAIGFLLALSGLALLFFYLEYPQHLPVGMSALDSADQLMPHFYAHQLPAGLGGLILAGFLCDAMQTLVSGVNSISAVVTKDVFDRRNTTGGRGELLLARLLTIGVGLTVTLLACGVTMLATESKLNIFDINQRTFNMFLGPLASLFFIGMFVPRCTSRSAVPAALCGVGSAFLWSYWSELCKAASHVLPGPAAEMVHGWSRHVPSMALAIAVPTVVSLLAALVFGLLFDRRDEGGRLFSWPAVMRRPAPQPVERQREAVAVS